LENDIIGVPIRGALRLKTSYIEFLLCGWNSRQK
jgi:hypothetical protein